MRPLFAVLLTCFLAAGCEEPFEPFEKNEKAFFSMFGYLDLHADTQWIRVSPVRRTAVLGPEPIDAVVTLEHVPSGRTVTLRDSLFAFEDADLEAVAYAHNFWTTERLQPSTEYRLTATRSDGVAATARVVTPNFLEVSLQNDVRQNDGTPGMVRVRAPRLLWVEMLYDVFYFSGGGGSEGVHTVRETRRVSSGEQGAFAIPVRSDTLIREEFLDVGRRRIRVTAADAVWPYNPALSDFEVALPNTVTSNVENGLGFVGGVAIRTLPYHRCQILVNRPNRSNSCDISFTQQSASLTGKVNRGPFCVQDPYRDREVRLVERFPAGGAIIRHWRTSTTGEYRFEGIEPGAQLELQFSGRTPPLQLGSLAPGQRFVAPDVSVAVGC